MKWRVAGAGWLILTLAAASGQDTPDWMVELARIKQHIKEDFQGIPNYVCREKVERFEKSVRRRDWTKVDTKYFDVAHVGNRELITPPGTIFEDKPLTKYIQNGSLSTGSFSAPLTILSNLTKITPHPNGAGILPKSYDYEISDDWSGSTVTSERGTAPVGLSGTFWVDPETLDLTHIEEHAVNIPPRIGILSADTVIEFGRFEIGAGKVLLAQSAELFVVRMDGAESRNHIEFSGCRAYQSESTVRFGDTVEPKPPRKK